MNLHEYQAKELLKQYGVAVPPGAVASTPDEAAAAAKELGGDSFVVKAQVHAGGRGRAGGVKMAATPKDVAEAAAKMLGTRLVTTQTGAEGKEVREFDGEHYVMERGLPVDVALIKAQVADKAGNLRFNKTARNFNPLAAMAGKVCVVEVEEIVETGDIDPDDVHLPGIFVHRIAHNPTPEKRIEKRTLREGN